MNERGYYRMSMSARSMQSLLPINGEFQIDSVEWDATRRVIEINISGAELPPHKHDYNAIQNLNLESWCQDAATVLKEMLRIQNAEVQP